MSATLLDAYARELDALRGLAAEFADAHPKIAGRLRLSAQGSDDPHVERLLEGVAFLAARVQMRLDDEFPEISDALLQTLYPYYLAPVPAAAIARLAPRADSRTAITVAAGTMLETEPVEGEPCRFRTAFETTLWPVAIERVRLSGLPLASPAHPGAIGAVSVLRCTLRATEPGRELASLGLAQLRLHLRGAPEQMLPLYELMSGHVVGVALADGPNDDRPTLLDASCVSPVGFAPDEALTPWDARGMPGFRLVGEYFAFADKFLFVDLLGLDARLLVQARDEVEIFIYFDRARPELERRLPPDCLQLGCTPIVNLFERACEPIRLDGTRTEYPVVVDSRHREQFEVWQVGRVREVAGDGSSRPWQPFYRHATAAAEPAGFFNTIRRDAVGPGGGTETLLAPFDPHTDVDADADRVLSVDALCTNRDLPARLPFGGGQPRLMLSEAIASVASVTCLTPPRPPARPRLRERRSWRLISQLSLGHLSVVGGPEPAATLREVLALHDGADTPESRAAIAALLSVSARPGTARVPGAWPGSFCRGLDVTLEFDRAAWESGNLFLLARVLERFLALYATVNSFVRVAVTVRGQAHPVARFPPRAGDRVLL